MLGDRYRLERRLGRGGMGEVWVAHDDGLDRRVAIKIVLTVQGGDPQLIARLRREARTAAGLQHSGITVVHDIGDHGGHPYFVMELLDGHDFTALRAEYPDGVPVELALGLMTQVADALAYAHEHGVVHRDIKPANLMRLAGGGVKVCDFGIARYVEATTGVTGPGLGTPAFMAPEQWLGEPVDARTDLYAFGGTLHTLLTGAPPFPGQTPPALMRQHLDVQPPHLREAHPDLPAVLDDLLQRLLAKAPADRPTVHQVKRAFQAALEPTTTPAPAPPATLIDPAAPGAAATPVAQTAPTPPAIPMTPPVPRNRRPANRYAAVAAIAVTLLAAVTGGLILAAPAKSGRHGAGGGTGSFGDRKLTVWLMAGSATDDFVKAFKAAHPSAQLDIQIQQWGNIDQKLQSALAGNNPPDVVEVASAQVVRWAAGGGLTDLTALVGPLKGKNWIPGLAAPALVDGKQYGIPFYAGNRVVIYNKPLFQAAGVAPPQTRDQWLDITRKLNSGGNQGIYLPGQSWSVLSGFVWDEGGELAVRDGTRWKGALSSPQALAGIGFYKQLQALGNAPKDMDEAESSDTAARAFAKGDVAQLIAFPYVADVATKANPELTGKVGFFPIPGKTPGKPGAVLTGGSDLIVPKASKNQKAAAEVVKALAGDQWQTKLAQATGNVPNNPKLASTLGRPGLAAMAAGAVNGHATPNSPNWATVEADNPIKQLLTKVLTGTDPATAARQADEAIDQALNP